jgi:hypothetical protein
MRQAGSSPCLQRWRRGCLSAPLQCVVSLVRLDWLPLLPGEPTMTVMHGYHFFGASARRRCARNAPSFGFRPPSAPPPLRSLSFAAWLRSKLGTAALGYCWGRRRRIGVIGELCRRKEFPLNGVSSRKIRFSPPIVLLDRLLTQSCLRFCSLGRSVCSDCSRQNTHCTNYWQAKGERE